jgi:hypothetical protein
MGPRSILGLSPLRTAFLVHLPNSQRRKAQGRGGTGIVNPMPSLFRFNLQDDPDDDPDEDDDSDEYGEDSKDDDDEDDETDDDDVETWQVSPWGLTFPLNISDKLTSRDDLLD